MPLVSFGRGAGRAPSTRWLPVQLFVRLLLEVSVAAAAAAAAVTSGGGADQGAAQGQDEHEYVLRAEGRGFVP